MDYQMDELNGMDTARQLRERNNKTVIIFLTSYPDIVFDTFEVNAFRFLVKPVNRKKLYKALDDYFKVFSEDEYLILNCPNITAVNFNDIIYVEAQNKTCVIHTVDGKIEYSRLLAEVEKKLPEDRFFKCHRAFIIGLKHVKGRDGRDVIFHNGQKADIAVKKYTLFKERLITYMKKYVFDVNTGGEVE
jgi:DNA-binding LytR/AlgR family response regulator